VARAGAFAGVFAVVFAAFLTAVPAAVLAGLLGLAGAAEEVAALDALDRDLAVAMGAPAGWDKTV
jgi:hypothetical protein